MEKSKIKQIIVDAFAKLEKENEEVPLDDLLEEIQKKIPKMTETELIDFLAKNEIF
jgi:hypothetical protein